MTERVIVAGFGGQGIVFMGHLLCYVAMMEGKEVCGIPSYGAEMRGGTANFALTISSCEIASPVFSNPDTAIIMNQPSLDKFEERIIQNGLLVINTSLISREIIRSDLKILRVPATEIASQIGNLKVANMVILGAYVNKTRVVALETVVESLPSILPEHLYKFLSLNSCALREGARYATRLTTDNHQL
ncbi:MAG: 2-oxoacid:acceptor oxidoreductase family protein [bacterium]|nr:2-oxoacid:acceptor oxidoreductase family protein [bacterium]